MKVLLFGDQASSIRSEFDAYPELDLVSSEDNITPEIVVCFGGDGTLLSAEREWPSIPKVPIRNSLRGNRCLPHPPAEVIRRLVSGNLVPTQYLKLACTITPANAPERTRKLIAMNEFNVHMAHITSAVRWRMWLDNEPYPEEKEILGDGFVTSTPFGSTAYFNHITRGFFYTGIGIAFKSTSEHTNHIIISEDVAIRILITRGPAILGHDNCTEYCEIGQGDELLIQRHDQSAIIYTWDIMKRTSDAF